MSTLNENVQPAVKDFLKSNGLNETQAKQGAQDFMNAGNDLLKQNPNAADNKKAFSEAIAKELLNNPKYSETGNAIRKKAGFFANDSMILNGAMGQTGLIDTINIQLVEYEKKNGPVASTPGTAPPAVNTAQKPAPSQPDSSKPATPAVASATGATPAAPSKPGAAQTAAEENPMEQLTKLLGGSEIGQFLLMVATLVVGAAGLGKALAANMSNIGSNPPPQPGRLAQLAPPVDGLAGGQPAVPQSFSAGKVETQKGMS